MAGIVARRMPYSQRNTNAPVSAESGDEMKEGGAIAFEPNGQFGSGRESRRLRTVGEVGIALQVELRDGGIVAEGGDVHDDGMRFTCGAAVAKHDDVRTIGVPGSKNLESGITDGCAEDGGRSYGAEGEQLAERIELRIEPHRSDCGSGDGNGDDDNQSYRFGSRRGSGGAEDLNRIATHRDGGSSLERNDAGA